VNAFTKEAPPVPVTAIDPAGERAQVERLRALRARRDAARHAAALAAIDRAARTTDNLVPLILDAVRAEATVGEISNVLRGVWGEHTETLVL